MNTFQGCFGQGLMGLMTCKLCVGLCAFLAKAVQHRKLGQLCKIQHNTLTKMRVNNGQDTFDHYKQQKSASSGQRLHWFCLKFLFFCASATSLCDLVRKPPKNLEKVAKVPGGEHCVKSCHVSSCHGFSSPEMGKLQTGFLQGRRKFPHLLIKSQP